MSMQVISTMSKGRRRFYQMEYPASRKPVHFDDFGHLIKITGVLVEGMGLHMVLLGPNATGPVWDETGLYQPTLEEWRWIIEAADDPQYFALDESKTHKILHRKSRMMISGAVQQRIWARDGWQCLYCGRRPTVEAPVPLTVDHWVPLEHGGDNDSSNYVCCCKRCNLAKGDCDPKEFCVANGYDYGGIADYLESGGKSKFMIIHLSQRMG